MSHQALHRVAHTLRRRINLGVWLERAGVATAVWLCVVGTLWVALKAMPLDRGTSLAALWALTGLPLVWYGTYVWCRARRKFFTDAECVTLADRLAFNDGSLVTSAERPEVAAQWASRALTKLTGSGQPLVRLDPRLHARRLALAFLYLLAVALAPERVFSPAAATAVLASELDLLTEVLEEDLLSEEQREELASKVKEMEEQAREMSQEQWEALQSMRSQVAQALQKQAESADALQRDVEAFERELDKAMEAAESEEEESAANNMEALANKAEALAKKLEESKSGNEKLREQQSQCSGGLKQFGQECRNPGEGKEGKEGGKQGKQKQPGNGKDLKKNLESLKKKLGECKSMCEGQGQRLAKGPSTGPGKGGITRGRGDAEMAYSDEAREIDHTLEEQLLDTKYQADEDAYTIDVTFFEPPEDGLNETAGQNVVRTGPIGPGGDARATVISPSQKDVVERYFTDGGKK